MGVMSSGWVSLASDSVESLSFLMLLLSFVMLGIYWNNHHHLLHATTRICDDEPSGCIRMHVKSNIVPVVPDIDTANVRRVGVGDRSGLAHDGRSTRRFTGGRGRKRCRYGWSRSRSTKRP